MLLHLLLACTPEATDNETDIDDSSIDTDENTETYPDDETVETPGSTDPDPAEEIGALDAGILPSHPQGFHDAPFELALSAESEDVTLRYTLDASDPAGDSGTSYTTPISIDETTVVRVAVFLGEELLARTALSYLFLDTLPDQTAPAGYPEQWWVEDDDGPYGADYEIDPEVVALPEWEQHFPGIFEKIPTLSLTIDPEDLFGETGIYENAEERGADWERAAEIAMMPAAGQEAFTAACGIRIHGGAGRRPDRSPKKSFRLLFKSEYGPTTLDHPLFEETDVGEFNTLVLRAGYNRTWVSWSSGGRERAQYLRELFGGMTQLDMGQLAPHARHVHLFLNGMYWGVYMIQERPDAAFQSSHLGGSRDDYDALNSGELVDGDLTGWETLLQLAAEDLSDDAAFEAVAELLDIDTFIDYMLINMVYGNIDWPLKNWWVGRNRAEDGAFAFFNWDTEFIFRYTYDDLTDVDTEETPGWIFQQLRNNPEFVVRFGDRVQLHTLNGGELSEERSLERWVEAGDRFDTAIIGESARWGDHWRDVRDAEASGDEAALYTYEDFWLEEHDYMQSYFIPTRLEKIHGIFQDAGLFPTLAAPNLSQHGGAVAAGETVSLSADDGTIYTTTDGSDPRLAGDGIASTAGTATDFTLTESTTLSTRAYLDGAWSPLVQVDFTVAE